MKFSESWLREWVDPALDTAALTELVTMAGLEVDAVEQAADSFNGLVVGEILSVEPHPDADKLRVCQVAGDPEGSRQVVCGAPNARAGIKVPYALVGAELPGGLKIKRAKLRGIESLGMLCAESELGISESDEGLWELPADAPVGTDLRHYLQLDDSVIELDLTPNRGDCLGIRGLAREVGVLCRLDVGGPAITPVAPVCDDSFAVSLEAGDKCPRYAGRVIRGIDISRPSPLWLVEKLRRSGIRSIDPVVDVSNYVMLELGQPMHAFDLDRLTGGISVRDSREGESIELLNGDTVELREGTLVIADQKAPLAMAGVMGGVASAVSENTRDLFLESAFFNPLAVVGQARSYGLHTDSSHRFERGVDPSLCTLAMERATELLLAIVGGTPGPVVAEERAADLPETVPIPIRKNKIKQQLAVDIESNDIEDIFVRLGLAIQSQDKTGWTVLPPGWRFDLTIEADLVEEVARIYGYNNLPTSTPDAALAIEPNPEAELPLVSIRRLLADRGYQEAITYSFVDPALQSQLLPEQPALPVANPISSDMAVMRTTLWAGLLPVLQRNLNRQQGRVRLFETGLRYIVGDGLQQQPMVAGLIYGERWPEQWNHSRDRVDFYDLKGDLEAVLELTGNAGAFVFEAAEHPALHPGQTAALVKGGEVIGYLGKLHPSLQKELDLPQPVYLFEVRVEPLRQGAVPRFREVSRFPAVRRDIAVIVDRTLATRELMDTVRQGAGALLIDLKVFDVYEGKGVDNNRKSVALGLTFQHESRTLNESEVNDAVEAVITRLQKQYKATLRG